MIFNIGWRRPPPQKASRPDRPSPSPTLPTIWTWWSVRLGWWTWSLIMLMMLMIVMVLNTFPNSIGDMNLVIIRMGMGMMDMAGMIMLMMMVTKQWFSPVLILVKDVEHLLDFVLVVGPTKQLLVFSRFWWLALPKIPKKIPKTAVVKKFMAFFLYGKFCRIFYTCIFSHQDIAFNHEKKKKWKYAMEK